MNDLLALLAGLPPLPRRPLTINPCPPGYSLQLEGGEFVCVLEEGGSGQDVLQRGRHSAAIPQPSAPPPMGVAP
jgi:hypothetical protein